MEARTVTDRFEWAALSRLAPSFTHEWPWVEQCANRIRVITYNRLQVVPVYLRAWVDEHMVGCPLLVLADATGQQHRVLAAPRSTPAVLNGDGDIDPTAAIRDVYPAVRFATDDVTEQVTELAARLDEMTLDTTRSWTITPRDLAGIERATCWEAAYDREVWIRWLTRLWQSSAWRTELVTHRSAAGGIIGWTVRLHRQGRVETAAVLVNGRPAPPWMSQDLRS